MVTGDDPGGWQERLAYKAELRARAGLRRELRPRSPGDGVVDLAGNDYLGLSRHPAVLCAAAAGLREYGLGATGSRLVRGSTDLHASLERGLARLLGTESALVYSSGYLPTSARCGPSSSPVPCCSPTRTTTRRSSTAVSSRARRSLSLRTVRCPRSRKPLRGAVTGPPSW